MKKQHLIGSLILLVVICVSFVTLDQEPWKPEQLMKPADLARFLSDADKTNDPVIYSIGPAGLIKDAIEIGAVNESKGLKLLQQKIQQLPKDRKIVVYCGCCPFNNCPNIRPAFTLLNKQGFKNHYLLDLPSNLKTDWIDKGFPMNKN